MTKIHGGFILVARQRDKSPIANCPPHFREIWDYLLRKATHTDKIISGTRLERGQCFVSFGQIQEDLKWFVGYRKMTYKKHHCEKAMKYFMKERMAETTKTTRGLIVTILNYDFFQSIENYESDSDSDNKATTKRQQSDTIYKNEKNIKNIKKKTYGEFENVHLTDEEHDKLVDRLGEVEAQESINNLSEYIESKGRKYKSHYATILAWERKSGNEKPVKKSNVLILGGRIVK